jgi:hypothetical protein
MLRVEIVRVKRSIELDVGDALTDEPRDLLADDGDEIREQGVAGLNPVGTKFDGAGTVTLNGAGSPGSPGSPGSDVASDFMSGTSWAVSIWRLRSVAPTIFAVVFSGPPPGPCHSSMTLSGMKPSTESAMPVSHE